MAYNTQFNLSQDNSFIQKVEMAMLDCASDITSELTSTPNHTNRAALAKLCANNPASYAPLFALAVLVDQTITLNTTDAALKTRVSAIWNMLAGVP